MKREVPVCIRNKNPFNIPFEPSSEWKGLVGENDGFCVFRTLELGCLAALQRLCRFHHQGYDTIKDITDHWMTLTVNEKESRMSYLERNIKGFPEGYEKFLPSDRDGCITSFKGLLEIAYLMMCYEIGWVTPSVHDRCSHTLYRTAQKHELEKTWMQNGEG